MVVNVVLKKMKPRDTISRARWILLPSALLVMLIAVPYLAALFKDAVWCSALEYLYWDPFWDDVAVGMICATLWVAISFSVAPKHRFLIAAGSILPGAWLAWFIIGESTFRVDGVGTGSFYATRAPTYLAWWMALATLTAFWFVSERWKKQSAPRKPVSPAIGISMLAFAIMLFCVLVLPATFIFWQFAIYCGTQRMIEKGDEEKTIKRVIRLHRMPFYDLDWTLPRAIARVPFGYDVYCTLACCPTCKGHWHTPFLLAARHGKLELLDKIIELRGSVEYGDDKGATVLHQALISKDSDVVRHLLSEGADVKAEMQFPAGSAVHRATVMQCPPEVLQVLLDAGGDINATDARGWTPLDWARVWNTNAIPFLAHLGARGGTNHTQELPAKDRKLKGTESTTNASTTTNQPALRTD